MSSKQAECWQEVAEARVAAAIDVRDEAGLELACEACRKAGTVALDTEFERVDTYFPKIALVQLATPDAVWLVDPLAVSATGPLLTLLEDAAVTKVLHACGADVEVFACWLGARPVNLFDTQLAAAFLGKRFGIGYDKLVALALGLPVDKRIARSNWLQRPLTPNQRRYACLDVIHLEKICRGMFEDLQSLGRLDWVFEETRRMVADELARPARPLDWRDIRGAAALPPRGQVAATALVRWRDQQARTLDRPRSRIVRDDDLLLIAQTLPENLTSLNLRSNLPAPWHGEIQAAVDMARAVPEEALPQAPFEPFSSGTHKRLLQRLRDKARAVAVKLGLAEELLARKRLLQLWLNDENEVPEPWRGWRWQILGEQLQAIVAGAPRARATCAKTPGPRE